MIVDTNALSAIADDRDHIRDVLGTASLLAIPVIVLGEYRFGIARSRDFGRYQVWLDEFVLVSRVLEIDEATARHYADLAVELKRIGRPIPTNDIWIASLCKQHDLPLLSKDRHFDVLPNLRRIEW